MRAYIGLGANVGDAPATLATAVHELAAIPGARLVAVSGLWRTAPVGVLDQPDFHNAVVSLDVGAGRERETAATALLARLKELERTLGRQTRERWGPREVDLDLLLFGRSRIAIDRPPGTESNDPARTGRPLVVPHPEAQGRLFVLAPLAELAPNLVPPGWNERVDTARDRAGTADGAEAARRVGTWTGARWTIDP